MNKAYLLTGGNTGDRYSYLQQAAEMIQANCGKIEKRSSFFETAAWGKTDQPPFLNQALLLRTSLTPPELMTRLLGIEERMGRKRMEKYGPRIIDIDILLYNKEVIKSTLVTIPHPELAGRRFALSALAEIAPRYMHPVLKKNIARLLKECPDTLPVHRLA
jgi:2-amino-4-hydroxy-6-hydroxymethyldihydropteridine diphosphokinase